MMKKLLRHYILGILFTMIFCGANAAMQAEFKLELVNNDNINAKAEKYYKKFCRAKNIKMLTYAALGIAAVGGTAWFIHDQYYKNNKPDNVGGKPADTKEKISEEKLAIAYYKALVLGRKFSFLKNLSDNVQVGIIAGLVTVILGVCSDVVGVGKSAFKGFVAGGNIDNVKIFQEKFAKIKELMLMLASMPNSQLEQITLECPDRVLFELGLNDLHITHRVMVNFIEDLFAFIKFLMMLRNDKDEFEMTFINNGCISLVSDFNNISKEISLIINRNKSANRQAFAAAYAVFCRNFTKFVCDCGVSLYGQDFLQR